MGLLHCVAHLFQISAASETKPPGEVHLFVPVRDASGASDRGSDGACRQSCYDGLSSRHPRQSFSISQDAFNHFLTWVSSPDGRFFRGAMGAFLNGTFLQVMFIWGFLL